MEERGCQELWCTVHPANQPSMDMSVALGFVNHGLDGSYFGEGEPRVLMKKDLGSYN